MEALIECSDPLPSFVLPLGAVAFLMRIVEQKRLAGQSCLVLLMTLAFSECTSVPLEAHIQDLLLKADGMLHCSMQLCPWLSTADALEYSGGSALPLLNDVACPSCCWHHQCQASST